MSHNAARYYEMAERARNARPGPAPGPPRAAAPPAPPFKITPFVRCPYRLCGAAADEVIREDIPFIGIECNWCGRCYVRTANGGFLLHERTVHAHDPPNRCGVGFCAVVIREVVW